jgi:chemotaxis protein CheD
MKKTIDVQTGQVEAYKGKVTLQTKAIGSCVAIVAYNVTEKIGALAHVMLPGRAPAKKTAEKMKYAANATEEIISKMISLGSDKKEIEVVLVGGGNILEKENDTICRDNIESVLHLIREKQLKLRARALGGILRRSVSLDVANGIVSCSEGDGGEKLLWDFKCLSIIQ